MDKAFWKDRLIERHILSYNDAGKLLTIDWEKVYVEYEPLGGMGDEEFGVCIDICMDEDILSLKRNGNFILFDKDGQFAGPRHPYTSCKLFFVRLSDAIHYRAGRFTRRQIPASIFKLEFAG